MFSIRKPTIAQLELMLKKVGKLSYTDIGLSKSLQTPPHYWTNYQRTIIGNGYDCFVRSKENLCALSHLNLDWIKIFTDCETLQENQLIVMSTQIMKIWVSNITRIIKIIRDENMFGFIYGTCNLHAMKGEEMFLLEYDDGKVYYTIYSYSKPRHILARLMILYIRRMQRRFRNESVVLMQKLSNRC